MAKNNKKKSTKKRGRRSHRGSQMVQLGRSPIADSAIVKLRFCLAVAINPASSGITGSHLFYVNNLYQPSVGATTHQPLGFDQYAGFYSRYTVLGSRITVKPINVSATIPIMYGVLLRQTSPGTAVDPMLLREQGDSNWAYAGNINSRAQGTVSKNFSAKKNVWLY